MDSIEHCFDMNDSSDLNDDDDDRCRIDVNTDKPSHWLSFERTKLTVDHQYQLIQLFDRQLNYQVQILLTGHDY
jgi:hypothetical protein